MNKTNGDDFHLYIMIIDLIIKLTVIDDMYVTECNISLAGLTTLYVNLLHLFESLTLFAIASHILSRLKATRSLLFQNVKVDRIVKTIGHYL